MLSVPDTGDITAAEPAFPVHNVVFIDEYSLAANERLAAIGTIGVGGVMSRDVIYVGIM